MWDAGCGTFIVQEQMLPGKAASSCSKFEAQMGVGLYLQLLRFSKLMTDATCSTNIGCMMRVRLQQIRSNSVATVRA